MLKLIKNWNGFLKIYLKGNWEKRNIHTYSDILRNISIPTLSQERKKVCDEEINEQEVITAMESFSNSKSPGSDGLTKEFYETFWKELKNLSWIRKTKQKWAKIWSHLKDKQ